MALCEIIEKGDISLLYATAFRVFHVAVQPF